MVHVKALAVEMCISLKYMVNGFTAMADAEGSAIQLLKDVAEASRSVDNFVKNRISSGARAGVEFRKELKEHRRVIRNRGLKFWEADVVQRLISSGDLSTLWTAVLSPETNDNMHRGLRGCCAIHLSQIGPSEAIIRSLAKCPVRG